ncbi:MAG: YicC family protein [Gammaproteobacteria bacterium]|nr:YicC family protein [Gammaproteobacteria bacterium]MDH3506124.1 YicC family protein [Gammaproteobacteria bacterium]
MPSSMTGFASTEVEVGLFRLVWEVRSVNHRFLDVGLRLPEELRKLEPSCKERIGAVIRRGKVDGTLRLLRAEEQQADTELSDNVLETLLDLQDGVLRRSPEARPLTVSELLRWPGVLEEPAPVLEDLERSAIDGLDAALVALRQARQSEGARLADALLQRCAGITDIVGTVAPRLGEAEQRYRAKLLERIDKLDLELEPERLEQEIALIAQRLDVAEELDRLASHVKEIEMTLDKDEAIGRRLDFIIQELNREANTFASKVQDEVLSRSGVELKVLIEQMREQVQNLE